MDGNTPLWKAHDISQQLQDKIEVLPNVERAFVHVDHEYTHVPVSFFSVSCATSTDLILRSIENRQRLSRNEIMDQAHAYRPESCESMPFL